MLCTLSSLKKQDIEEIKTLEQETGHIVLAFSCHKSKPSLVDKNTLEKIQSLENKLGLSLVAVEL